MSHGFKRLFLPADLSGSEINLLFSLGKNFQANFRGPVGSLISQAPNPVILFSDFKNCMRPRTRLSPVIFHSRKSSIQKLLQLRKGWPSAYITRVVAPPTASSGWTRWSGAGIVEYSIFKNREAFRKAVEFIRIASILTS